MSISEKKLRDRFEEFKKNFGKKYITEEEDNLRFSLFKKYIEQVEKHNKEYDKGLVLYAKGFDVFSDWTEEERQSLYNCYRIN